MKDMVITGVGPLDEVYSNERGTWNVTRIRRDALAGKFGGTWVISVADAIAATVMVEADAGKVERFKTMPAVLAVPLLGVMEDFKCWLVDGHHRLRALHAKGVFEVEVFVVPLEMGSEYHVLYNGRRTCPGIHLGA